MSTRTSKHAFAEPWGGHGRVSDVDGHPVHWVEFGAGDDASGPPFVLVHGLGGSHLNWVRLAPLLAATGRRVIALDLAGFGLTEADGRSTAVGHNRRLLDAFLRDIVEAPAVLVGNSMGGMITILQAHANPGSVVAAVLLDPALPLPVVRPDLPVLREFLLFSTPGFGEFYMKASRARLSARQQVTRTVELCFADPTRIDPSVLEASIALFEARRPQRGKEHAFLQASRSLVRTLAAAPLYRRRMAELTMPVLLVHGTEDRLVSVVAARAIERQRPNWDFRFLPGVGHTPQLEVSDETAEIILGWTHRQPPHTPADARRGTRT